MEENTPSIQLTLEELKNQLENWRKNKTNHREPIPKELWEAAVELARFFQNLKVLKYMISGSPITII